MAVAISDITGLRKMNFVNDIFLEFFFEDLLSLSAPEKERSKRGGAV